MKENDEISFNFIWEESMVVYYSVSNCCSFVFDCESLVKWLLSGVTLIRAIRESIVRLTKEKNWKLLPMARAIW